MRVSTKMGLRIWNLLTDPYDHEQLADNWQKVDAHDHSPGRGVLIPSEGLADELIVFRHLSPTIFPVVTATGGALSISAAEEKPLAGGPTLTVTETGEYELGLMITIAAKTQEALGRVRVNAVATYDLAHVTNAKVQTTNFVRVESFKTGDVLDVSCETTGAEKVDFTNARLWLWRIR